MSRALHPSGWRPSCWFAVGAIAVSLIVSHYSIGAP
jgi:hypothetical protein